MDFLDPAKKRSHLIRLYIGYFLVAIAIALGSLVLLFAAYGYGVDKKGNVIQNGLVFISSAPAKADVRLSNISGTFGQSGETNSRFVLPADTYNVSLIADGYRTWRREFSLNGSSVERLTYPLLFPEKLKTTTLQTYSKVPEVFSNSPDRHWLLVSRPGALGSFDIYDSNDPKQPIRAISLPTGLLQSKGSAHTVEVIEWADDNTTVLIKHSFEGGVEFATINLQTPGQSVNLNNVLNFAADSIILKNKKSDQFFVTKGEQVFVGLKKNGSLSPFLSHVLAFRPEGDDVVVFVSKEKTAATGKVEVRIRSNDEVYVLRELPASSSYVLDLARYSNKWYFVVGERNEDHVYIYRDPLNALKERQPKAIISALILKIPNPQEAVISENGRFIAAKSGQKFAVYDAETDRSYRYEVKKPLVAGHPLKWMDGYRISSVSDGKVLVFDFDGTNPHSLSPSLPLAGLGFDKDYKGLYNLADSVDAPGQFAVTRTELEVK